MTSYEKLFSIITFEIHSESSGKDSSSLNKGITIEIQTIDSFQGQERDVIIVSLVRCNNSSEIGFLQDYRRMNVAMTRAKKKLVLIGDSATLGKDLFYKALIEHSERKADYVSAWELLDV